MLKRIIFCILIFAFVCRLSLAHADYVPGEVLVKFKPGVVGMAADIRASSVGSLTQKYGISRYEKIYKRALKRRPGAVQLADRYKIVFPKETDVLEVVKAFKRNPNVVHAQPNYIYRAYETIPNDPYYLDDDQWGLTKIQAENAWDRTTGESSVVIAVIDTGVDYNHEDLQGKVDTANGYDYVNNDPDAMDDYGHGTNVAGIIAAATNNGKGVAGVNWHAVILPLKVLSPSPGGATGSTEHIVAAIEDAPDLGADIINMSFGLRESRILPGEYDDVEMQQAVDRAFGKGAVLLAAVGNDGTEEKNYPAANNHVLAVAATDRNDKRSIWNILESSNYGSWVDVSAPGTTIYSTNWGGGYGAHNGTSFATPFVSGLAGLIKSANPALSNQQIMDVIVDTVDNIDSLNPGYEGKLGSGRINAYLALSGIQAEISSPADSSYIKGPLDVYGTASGWDFSKYILEVQRNGTLVATLEESSISIESNRLGSWDTAGYNGEYHLKLTVFSKSLGSMGSIEAEVKIFADNIAPEAEIAFPANGATVAGSLTILGTAEDQYLDRYYIEYGEGSSPAGFEKIKIQPFPAYGYESYVSVQGGVLGTWETTGLSGIYSLRLRVYDKVGTAATKTVLVNLQNTSDPTKGVEPQAGLPLTYALPNPFDRSVTSEATFNYTLQGNFDTRIYLFDLAGNLIWRESYLAGENGGKSGGNNPVWDGKDNFGVKVSSGVYFYQIVADKKALARGKIIVLN